MQTEQLILVETFCVCHNVEFSFMRALHETGLVEITTKENVAYIPESNIKEAEQFVRLHHDLELNLEGIETVIQLLDKLKEKEDEIMRLKNKLRFYE
ncbi:MAG: chaperone modulator CbpM [Ferruginibacter sp.]